MTARRLGLLVVAVVSLTVALSAATAGGNYSTTDRSATVAVASEETAYLGLETQVVRASSPERNDSNATAATRLMVRLENRFGDGTHLNAVVTAGGQDERVRLRPDEAATVSFPGARCGQRVRVHATTPAGSLFVETVRDVPCPPTSETRRRR